MRDKRWERRLTTIPIPSNREHYTNTFSKCVVMMKFSVDLEGEYVEHFI